MRWVTSDWCALLWGNYYAFIETIASSQADLCDIKHVFIFAGLDVFAKNATLLFLCRWREFKRRVCVAADAETCASLCFHKSLVKAGELLSQDSDGPLQNVRGCLWWWGGGVHVQCLFFLPIFLFLPLVKIPLRPPPPSILPFIIFGVVSKNNMGTQQLCNAVSQFWELPLK